MKSTSWPPLFALSILYALQVSGRAVSAQEKVDLHSFVTRPELKAPKWDISIHEEEHVSSGYWFVGVYDANSRTDRSEGWTGPHIYDSRGQLIWSGAKMSARTGMDDFQLRRLNDHDVLTIYRPDEDETTYLNEQYENIGEEATGGAGLPNTRIVDDGRHELVIEHSVGNATEEISRAVGLEEGICKGAYDGFKEVDTKTGSTIFRWNSQRHISLNESTMEGVELKIRCNRQAGWDFLHLNSVAKCPDGDYLLSGQYTDTIYKVSRRDGGIIWRLGGKTNQFTRGPLKFSRQSELQCLSTNITHTTIALLDNARSPNNPADLQFPSGVTSRGLVLSVNTEDMTATLLNSYSHPDGPGNYAMDGSTYQTLPNGNAFISWTDRSYLTEYTPNGTLVQKVELLPSWLNSYRTYKFDFVGRPLTSPDVVAQASTNSDNTTTTDIYVSWNGATEVGNWTLYKTDHQGQALTQLETKQKEGFETHFTHNDFVSHVLLEAFDAQGRSLGKSKPITTLPPPDILASPIEEQMEWLKDNHASPVFEARGGLAWAFFGGFVLAVSLVGLAYAVRWVHANEVWLRGFVMEMFNLKTGDAQQYIPLTESPGKRKRRPSVVVEEC